MPRTPAPTPILIAWSGGKDAAWTLHTLRQSRQFAPVALLSTVTEGHDRIAMQGIRCEVLHAQAGAAGLPVIESRQPPAADNAAYEAAFADGLATARRKWPGIEHIAFGDLFLADIRAFREELLARHGWHGVFPLFGRDTREVAVEMLCCVDTRQLDAAFAGREFDAELIDGLPTGVDPCGENGEFHTCVYAGPFFARALPIEAGETVLRDKRFAYTDHGLR
jgi:uncharacterized protein (TIGR00290 family)